MAGPIWHYKASYYWVIFHLSFGKKTPTNPEMRDIFFFWRVLAFLEKFWTPIFWYLLNTKSLRFSWFRWFAPIQLGHFQVPMVEMTWIFLLVNNTWHKAWRPQNHGTIIFRLRFNLSIAGSLGQCWLCATVTWHLWGPADPGNLIKTQQNRKVFRGYTFTTDIFRVWNFQFLYFSMFFWVQWLEMK